MRGASRTPSLNHPRQYAPEFHPKCTNKKHGTQPIWNITQKTLLASQVFSQSCLAAGRQLKHLYTEAATPVL